MTAEKLGEIDRRIAEPNGVQKMPGHLGDTGHDDACPGCPIIDGLPGGTTTRFKG